MRFILAFLAVATSVLASDLPKNLLRYNVGALPMTTDSSGAWTAIMPESIDWNASYAMVLAGDIGRSVDLATTKTFVIDLGYIEQTNRFSLFSRNASGTLSVYSSPVFEDPASEAWTQLGSLNMVPNQPASATWSDTEARYLKLVFSPESKGIVESMGLFGALTYNDVRGAETLQTGVMMPNFALNYATPATQMEIVQNPSDATIDPNALMALFDDDPASLLNIQGRTSVTVNLGDSREIETLAMLANNPNLGAEVQLGNELSDLDQASPVNVKDLTTLSVPSQVHFARITFNPSAPTGVSGFSFVGPIDPNAFVFDRAPTGDTPTAGPRRPNPPPVPPKPPRRISRGGVIITIPE